MFRIKRIWPKRYDKTIYVVLFMLFLLVSFSFFLFDSDDIKHSLTGFAMSEINTQALFNQGSYNQTFHNGSAVILNDSSEGNTVLLLHFNGPDDSTNDAYFVDSSGQSHNPTQEGNVKLEDTQKYFGETSANFAGSGDYVSVADSDDWNLGSGDFTIDAWVWFDSTAAANRNFVEQGTAISNTANFNFYYVTGSIYFDYSTNGGTSWTDSLSVSWTPTQNAWTHVAVVRKGSNLYFFINGTQQGSTQSIGTDTLPDTNNILKVGNSFYGHIDEVRVVKGEALWTSNFNLPTREYGSGEYVGDVIDAGSSVVWNNISFTYDNGSIESDDPETVLLLHFDGTDNSVTDSDFIDNSSKRHTVTQENNAKLENIQKKFGSTSAYFDGTTDTVTIPDSNDFYFGDENFTIDFWMRPATVSANLGIMTQQDSTGHRFSLRTQNSGSWLSFDVRDTNSQIIQLECAHGISANTWAHIALVRENDDFTFYVDGSSICTTNDDSSIPNYNADFVIGDDISGDFEGYIDEFRVTKGVARWTSDFTVPSSAYSDPSLPIDPNASINFSVRSCDDSECSGESWTDISDTSPQDLSVDNNRYFQYQFEMDTDNLLYSPAVFNVSIDYDTVDPPQNYSLLFNGSSYLNWTPNSEGNRTTWTWSAWVKSDLSIDQGYFYTDVDSNNFGGLYGPSTYALELYFKQNNVRVCDVYNDISFVSRDPSVWNHILIKVDTTQATDTDRVKFFINNDLLPIHASSLYPEQDLELLFSGVSEHFIGNYSITDSHYYGYINNINLIDGQALTPNSFGQYNEQGKWVPKDYIGSYGTNGFHLAFNDSSDLGKDYSGNNNDWTANDFDSDEHMVYDTPLNNYATLNPLFYDSDSQGSTLFGEGNLYYYGETGSTITAGSSAGTIAIPSSGKWYFEFKLDNAYSYVGIGSKRNTNYLSYYADDIKKNGNILYNPSYDFNDGDIIGVAVNANNKSVEFYKNNVLFGINYDYSDLDLPVFPKINDPGSSFDGNAKVFFGATGFNYPIPEGYKALSTANLPGVSIQNASKYFNVVTYVGNGAQRYIDCGMKPDLVWIKNLNETDSHKLFDSVRGATKYLQTDSTAGNITDANSLTAFIDTGFSLGTGANGFNDNGETFVAYCWKESPLSGFDIVNYTGNQDFLAVEHDLGETPDFFTVKALNVARDWMTYHKDLNGGTNPEDYFVRISATDGEATHLNAWNSTAPNSTHFVVGAYDIPNELDKPYISYLWRSVPGFSKIGSYTGNGDADGPFIYTGFKPKYLILKNIDGSYNWVIHDSVRDTTNPQDLRLEADNSNSESTTTAVDFLDNGFKVRTSGGINVNSENITYIAFAEYSLANQNGYTPVSTKFDFDFSDYNETEIQSLSNLKLSNEYAEVAWNKLVNATGANLDDNVILGENYVYVNSDVLDESFNSSSNLTIYTSEITYPSIMKDGAVCSDCTQLSWDGSVLIFNVTGFSNYTVENSTVNVTLYGVDNESIDFSNVVFNCSATDLSGNLYNITLYSDYYGSWQEIETASRSGEENWSSFTRDIYSDRGNFVNGGFLWNCYACNSGGVCSFSSSNNSFSNWDYGVHNNTIILDNDVVLGYNYSISMIDRTEGSITTSLTRNTANAFDGVTNQVSSSCADIPTSASGYNNYIGKTWGEGNEKNVTQVKIYASNDYGFLLSGGTINMKIQAYNGSSWIDLYTGAVSNSVGAVISIDSLSNYEPYERHRVNFEGNGANSIQIAEVQFFENLTEHYSLGNYTSKVFDAGELVSWDSLDYNFDSELFNNYSRIVADDAEDNDYYGFDVDISADGNVAVVGAFSEDGAGSNRGAIYVYEKVSGVWSQIDKITLSSPQDDEEFGRHLSVSSNGNMIVSSVTHDSSNIGKAYVFVRNGNEWEYNTSLTASDGVSGDYFGSAISISENDQVIVVGTHYEDGSGTDRGAVYVYVNNSGTWTQKQKVVPDDPSDSAYFGYSVDISEDGSKLLIGAITDDAGGTEKGSAYVFLNTSGSWTQDQKLTASDGSDQDRFGWSVAISDDGDYVVIGADTENVDGGTNVGAAYVFVDEEGTWNQKTKLKGDVYGNQYYFGNDVSIANNGEYVMVSSYRENVTGEANGAVYVFELSNNNWTKTKKLTGEISQDNAYFGYSASLSSDGKTLLAGAYNSIATNKGEALIYESQGVEMQTRTSDNNETWSSWSNYTSGVIDSSARYIQYKALLSTDNDSLTPSLNWVNISYSDNIEPMAVVLNTPLDENNTIDFNSVVFNCSVSATEDETLVNVSLYSDYNGSWQKIATNSVGGVSNSTSFTRNILDDLGLNSNSFLDSGYQWNCLAYDTSGASDWGNENYTFSNWDLGNQGNTTINNSVVLLSFNSSGIYENTSGVYTSRIFDAGELSSWGNLSYSSDTITGLEGEDISVSDDAISNDVYSSYYASNAFDDNGGTRWGTSSTGGGTIGSYIGQNWTTPKNIMGFTYTGISIDNFCTQVKVETYDGSSWSDHQTGITTLESTSKQKVILDTPTGEVYGIRITDTIGNIHGNRLFLYELEFLESLDYNNLSIQTRTSDDNVTWSLWSDYSSGVIDNSARYMQYKALLSTDNVSFTPLLNWVNISYSDNLAPIVVVLNTPLDENNTIDFNSVVFNCSVSATEDETLVNVSLYSDYNGSWQKIATNSVGGVSNSTSFTRNILDDLGLNSNSFLDSGYQWNCLAYDTSGTGDWGNENYTFSNWDLGNQGNTTINNSVVLLSFNSSGIYENTSGVYTSRIFDAGELSSWDNLSYSSNTITGLEGEDISVSDDAISNDVYSSYYASNAFDDNGGTRWGTSSTGASTQGLYIGQNWTTPKNIMGFTYTGISIDNFCTQVKVETYDGSSWSDHQIGITTLESTSKQKVILDTPTGEVYGIRITDTIGNIHGNRLFLYELEFLESLDYNNLSIQTRTSDDNVTWSLWSDYSSGIIDNSARYMQYKALLSTDNVSFTPLLNWVNISYSEALVQDIINGGSATVCDSTHTCLFLQNSTNDFIARFDSSGNVDVIGGYYNSQPSLIPNGASFMIQNSTNDLVAYFDKNGNLYTLGAYTKTSSITPSGGDDFIVQNKTGDYVGYIDGATGNLYFLGELHYNSDFS